MSIRVWSKPKDTLPSYSVEKVLFGHNVCADNRLGFPTLTVIGPCLHSPRGEV